MKRVKLIAVSRLLKVEVQVLLESVIRILKKFDLEQLRLQTSNDILVGQAAKIQFFTTPYGEHPITPRLAILRKERLDCASFIAMQVRSFEKSTFKNLKEMSVLAKWLSVPFLTNLGQKSQHRVYGFITNFFINLDANPEVQEAYNTLGLELYVDELRRLNNEYYDVYTERELDIINRPPTSNRALERETQRMLRQFFEQVNSSQMIFSDIDYSDLISALNTKLAVYSKSINTRIATNKRRARKKAKAEAMKKAAEEKASSHSSTKSEDDEAPDKKAPKGGEDIQDKNKDTPKPNANKKGAEGNVPDEKKQKRGGKEKE